MHPKRPNAICFHRMCFSNFEIKQIRTADALNRCCSQRIQLLQAVLTRYVRLKMVVMSDYPGSSPPASRRPQQATSYGESSFPQERTPARPNLAGDAPEPAGSGRFLHTGPRHVLLTAQMWVDTAPPAQHQPIMSLYKVFIVYICHNPSGVLRTYSRPLPEAWRSWFRQVNREIFVHTKSSGSGVAIFPAR